jgi:alpha-tubulin suppressor-like RCC1 family protein
VAPPDTLASVDNGSITSCDLGLACDARPVVALGPAPLDARPTPVRPTFKSVAIGFAHSCNVLTDDSIACWGRDDRGQSSPPGGAFKTVAVGSSHTCRVRADDTVECWGWDRYGQSTPP